MKRIICVLLSMILLCTLAVSVMATGEVIADTSDSSFETGGTGDGATFTLPDSGITSQIPEITTKNIPNGKVGENYYQKLECSDPDVVFSLFRSSLPDGLTLTQHGEIEGIPTKEGFWYVVIMATPEAGAEYAVTAEYEITIEAVEEYSLEIMELPDKVDYIVGEQLDLKGLWVRIYTPDGFLDSRDGKDLTYTQDPLSNVGERKIKISYKDAFTFFYVNVKEAPKHEHKDHLTKVEAKPATCTENGSSEYYICSCDKLFKDAEATTEIPDLNSVTIPAAHTYGNLIQEIPAVHTATELKAGTKAHYLCSKCNTYFTAEKVATTKDALVIAAPVHQYNTENGYRKADGHANTCSCGAHNSITPHTPNIPAPTETKDQICANCGYVMNAATGHVCTNHLARVPAADATCTQNGIIEYYKCSCGKYYTDSTASREITDQNSVIIPASHHHGTDWKSDQDHHWNECVCGDRANTAAHKDENSDDKCDVCTYNLKIENTAPPQTDVPTLTEPKEEKDSLLWFWGFIAVAVVGVGIAVFAINGKKKK